MQMIPSPRTLAALTASLCLCASAVAQNHQSSSALINEQLDQLIKLDLNKTPLPQVFKSIETQTGVPIRVTDDVYETLPWGAQTPITASFDKLKLRDALNAIGSKSGLQFDLRDEFVECAPQPPLRRLGRRATLEELRTLDFVKSTSIGLSAVTMTIPELARLVDDALLLIEKTKGTRIVLEIRSSPNANPANADLAKTVVTLQRNATIGSALDVFDQQSPLTWYPWGDSIVILPKQDVIRHMLERSVTLRYDGVDIGQVLMDLEKKTNVPFMIEPGAIQRVTPEFRIIKLNADATVRQSLESLQGYTGLGYVVTDQGVYIWNQNSTPTAGRGRVIGTVSIGGVNVLVYEDQLSAEARAALKAKQQKAVAALEAELTGKPTTQPEGNN